VHDSYKKVFDFRSLRQKRVLSGDKWTQDDADFKRPLLRYVCLMARAVRLLPVCLVCDDVAPYPED